MGKYLLLRLAEKYRWVTAPKWVSTPYCIYIYICVYIRRYAHIQKKNHVRPFPRKREPAEIVTPSLPGHGGCDDPSGHRAPLPAKIVTPSLSGHGGCDDPFGPLCALFLPILSRPPCLGMVAVTILGGQCAPLHAQKETSQYRHTFPVWAWGHTARKIILG